MHDPGHLQPAAAPLFPLPSAWTDLDAGASLGIFVIREHGSILAKPYGDGAIEINKLFAAFSV